MECAASGAALRALARVLSASGGLLGYRRPDFRGLNSAAWHLFFSVTIRDCCSIARSQCRGHHIRIRSEYVPEHVPEDCAAWVSGELEVDSTRRHLRARDRLAAPLRAPAVGADARGSLRDAERAGERVHSDVASLDSYALHCTALRRRWVSRSDCLKAANFICRESSDESRAALRKEVTISFRKPLELSPADVEAVGDHEAEERAFLQRKEDGVRALTNLLMREAHKRGGINKALGVEAVSADEAVRRSKE